MDARITTLTCVAVLAAGAFAAAPGPACPGDGNCFEPNGTPGCDDETCCLTVCDLEPFCCEVKWDQACVNQAVFFCEPCPGTGHCLAFTETPGCSDEECCNLVCDIEPDCCQVAWEGFCVSLAQTNCPWLCLGDLNTDGERSVEDLIQVIVDWDCEGSGGACPGDVNEDGLTNVGDLVLLILNWGPC